MIFLIANPIEKSIKAMETEADLQSAQGLTNPLLH
jgi:hypothetical protein